MIILIVVCRVEEDTLILDNPLEREQEVELEASFSLIVIIITISRSLLIHQLVNKKRSLTHVSLRIQKRAPPCLISSLNVQIYCMPLKLKRF